MTGAAHIACEPVEESAISSSQLTSSKRTPCAGPTSSSPPFQTFPTRYGQQQPSNGEWMARRSSQPYPQTRSSEIQTVWHERRIGVLSLKRTRRLRSWTHEVQYEGGTAVAKIACFEWDVRRIERETEAYRKPARHRTRHPGEPPVAPEFLGHLTENGRVMGLLLQKIEGERACLDDLPDCEALLRRVHGLGMIHGDVNRHNFVVDRAGAGGVRLVDFEHFEDFDEEAAMEELLTLPAVLAEDTGRGATSKASG